MRSFVQSLFVRLILLAAFGLLAAFAPVFAPAFAQDTPPASSSAAPAIAVEDLKGLAATLEDEARRSELLLHLRTLIAAQEQSRQAEPAPGLGDWTMKWVVGAAGEAEEALGAVTGYFGDWPALVAWAKRELQDPAARARGLNEALAFVGIFAAGWIAEFLVWMTLSGTRRRLDGPAQRTGVARVVAICGRVLLDLLPLATFAASAYAAAILIGPTPKVRAVGLNFVNAYLVARALLAAARLVLAPRASSLRLLPLGDAVAANLFVWFRRFIVVGVGGYFLIGAAFLLGLPKSGAYALLRLLGAVLLALAVAFVLHYRRRVAGWLRRRADTASRRFGAPQLLRGFASIWHVLAIGYITGFFVVAAFGIEGGFSFMLRGTLMSLLIVAVAWILILGVHGVTDRLSGRGAGGSLGRSPLHPRAVAYLPVSAAILRLVVVIGAILAVAQAWGADVVAWLDRPFSQWAFSTLLSLVLVLGVAILVWELASNAIERYLKAPGRDGNSVQRSARVRTLLPLLRKGLFLFLSLMVVLITLSEFGVDIAPLLAGAGVIGLAVGFGAQTLVKDVITGVFMLVEDALAVGDVVNVAGLGGVVEDLSIRSIRLRDTAGSVHTVPFSSVGTVTNLTKDFSYYVLDIGVAYREDPTQVGEVCAGIVEEMRADPRFAADILEPMEVFGIDQFGESAMVIKARIKTRPIRQWAVGREFNGRMKRRFDELGIEMPFPHRTLYLGVDKHGEAPPLRLQVDGGAATPPAPAPAPSGSGDDGAAGQRGSASASASPVESAVERVAAEGRSGRTAQPSSGRAEAERGG